MSGELRVVERTDGYSITADSPILSRRTIAQNLTKEEAQQLAAAPLMYEALQVVLHRTEDMHLINLIEKVLRKAQGKEA